MPDRVNETAAQSAAEAGVEAVKDELGPFVVAAETTRMPMVFTDAVTADNPYIFVNDAFLELTGYERETILGKDFCWLLADAEDAETLAKVAGSFAGTCEDDPVIALRAADGHSIWAAVMINPVRDETGRVMQHFASFVDQSQHRARHEQSQILIDELNHRVKNTLATVQSIVVQALRGATDPAMVRDAIETRIQALSRSHDLLTRERWEAVGLHDIVSMALQPFGVAAGRGEHFTIDGDNIGVTPRATLALGIAFHELATNAVKYGAFSVPGGCVRVSWAVRGGDRLVIVWDESDGPPVVPRSHKGFGSRVIERGLAHELGGVVALDFRREGVVCTIDIPAPLHDA